MKFPFYKQLDKTDSGPSCLFMVSKFYGKTYNLNTLRELAHINRDGASFLSLSTASEKIGFRTMGVKMQFATLKDETPLPVIIHWQQKHFFVIYKIAKGKVWVADPNFGLITYAEQEFQEKWVHNQPHITEPEKGEIDCLILEPTTDFYKNEGDKQNKSSLFSLLRYYRPYRNLILQLFTGLFAGILLQFMVPFLTESIVDIGISSLDLGFIGLVLIAQLFVFMGQQILTLFRSWLLLHVNTRVSVAIIAEFLMKLMRLPISFFETRRAGDIMQRIQDNNRIDLFLSINCANIISSGLSLFVFSIIMAYYDLRIFLIFVIGSALYVAWVLLFFIKRRELDFKQFDMNSAHQNTLIELIAGMQEIKLQNYERAKRWEWERLRANIYKVEIRKLAIKQIQHSGTAFIGQLKNILIIGISAYLVVKGELSIGMMLSIQYILGQLNAPLVEVINFLMYSQDARISLERLNEIHDQADESHINENRVAIIPKDGDLVLEDVKFRYEGADTAWILNGISVCLPRNKVTAIVGASGSGKTTFIKLLLGFYEANEGSISVSGVPLNQLDLQTWRKNCGAVMQDGFIFSDTISKNITVNENLEDTTRVIQAAKLANIHDTITTMPAGYNTRIGNTGMSLSMGQKQRLLIARVAYKNPNFVFFDESTNALDSNNERKIVENLDQFYVGKTVVIVAHRLSTVRNADQILVLDKGKITEIGNHEDLIVKKGAYYELIKNQLELTK